MASTPDAGAWHPQLVSRVVRRVTKPTPIKNGPMSRRSVSYVLSSLMNLKRDQERAAWLQAADTPLLEGDFFEQIIRAIYTAILQPGDLAVDVVAPERPDTVRVLRELR